MRKLILIFLLVILLINGCITGNTVKEGPFLVVNVIDGDTLDLDNGERIRLSGINTPETGECYYSEAKSKLRELALNKEVFLEKDRTNIDKYGRKLRYVYSDVFVNGVLVSEGYAKVYDKYKDDTKKYSELKKLEKNAVENNLGVWRCVDNKENCLFVGSLNSDKYHTPDCKYAKKIKVENLICFNSLEETEGREFSGCWLSESKSIEIKSFFDFYLQ